MKEPAEPTARFPDNARRRVVGLIYVVVAVASAALWFARGDAVFVNRGMLFAALLLGAAGAYHLIASQALRVRETEALEAAIRAVGFPAGRTSAQLGWRGLRSRPTWRVLVLSGDEPPTRRGLVLVDAVDGTVVAHLVEQNDPATPGGQ